MLTKTQQIVATSQQKFHKRTNFVPRSAELLELEGKYSNFTLSCRHRDILRCSTTKHFTSCFRSNGLESNQPILYCFDEKFCIIYQRDRSGAFNCRVFGYLLPFQCDVCIDDLKFHSACTCDECMVNWMKRNKCRHNKTKFMLRLSRVYGNPANANGVDNYDNQRIWLNSIVKELSDKIRTIPGGDDVYLPVLGL